MQNCKTLQQPLLGELAMSRKREREKNAIYSGHLRLCLQPRAAHALRSDQKYVENMIIKYKGLSKFIKGKNIRRLFQYFYFYQICLPKLDEWV
jgi:hypothetical protein